MFKRWIALSTREITIQWISIGKQIIIGLRYPVDSDLFGGYHYPTFEQPGLAVSSENVKSDCDCLACIAVHFFGCVFHFLGRGVRDSAAQQLIQGPKRKRCGIGRGVKAVRKTACNQPLEIFESESAFGM